MSHLRNLAVLLYAISLATSENAHSTNHSPYLATEALKGPNDLKLQRVRDPLARSCSKLFSHRHGENTISGSTNVFSSLIVAYGESAAS